MFDNYACVSGEDELRTIQMICDANTGEVLIKNDTADYADNQDHFWNLAIKTDYGYSKEDLVVLERIDVPDPDMYKAMLKAIEENENLQVLYEQTTESSIVVQYGAMKKGASFDEEEDW